MGRWKHISRQSAEEYLGIRQFDGSVGIGGGVHLPEFFQDASFKYTGEVEHPAMGPAQTFVTVQQLPSSASIDWPIGPRITGEVVYEVTVYVGDLNQYPYGADYALSRRPLTELELLARTKKNPQWKYPPPAYGQAKAYLLSPIPSPWYLPEVNYEEFEYVGQVRTSIGPAQAFSGRGIGVIRDWAPGRQHGQESKGALEVTVYIGRTSGDRLDYAIRKRELSELEQLAQTKRKPKGAKQLDLFKKNPRRDSRLAGYFCFYDNAQGIVGNPKKRKKKKKKLGPPKKRNVTAQMMIERWGGTGGSGAHGKKSRKTERRQRKQRDTGGAYDNPASEWVLEKQAPSLARKLYWYTNKLDPRYHLTLSVFNAVRSHPQSFNPPVAGNAYLYKDTPEPNEGHFVPTSHRDLGDVTYIKNIGRLTIRARPGQRGWENHKPTLSEVKYPAMKWADGLVMSDLERLARAKRNGMDMRIVTMICPVCDDPVGHISEDTGIQDSHEWRDQNQPTKAEYLMYLVSGGHCPHCESVRWGHQTPDRYIAKWLDLENSHWRDR